MTDGLGTASSSDLVYSENDETDQQINDPNGVLLWH